jgi:hypothetical protein
MGSDIVVELTVACQWSCADETRSAEVVVGVIRR